MKQLVCVFVLFKPEDWVVAIEIEEAMNRGAWIALPYCLCQELALS